MSPMVRSKLPLLLLIVLWGAIILTPIARAGEAGEGRDRKHRVNVRGFFLFGLQTGESDAHGSASGAFSCQVCIPVFPGTCYGFSGDFSGEGSGETQNAAGFMFGAEYLIMNGHLGLEADFVFVLDAVKYQLQGDFTNISGVSPSLVPPIREDGALDIQMIGLCLNYHLKPENRLDFYAGPFFAPAVNMSGIEEVDIGESVAFGLNVGADYRLKRSLIITANLRFIDFGQVEIDENYYMSLAQDLGIGKCGGTVAQQFEASDDLRYLGLLLGIGYRF
ncbi:MAG: hypothetical protein JXB45_12925 [Candidatus Krumholzibacteriota bacterium]|nr:hypothetical protein [Candidatus Krumholzibacteriota bacterium]